MPATHRGRRGPLLTGVGRVHEMKHTTDAGVARLRYALREMRPVLVAFSGGVDSSVLLAVAVGELGIEEVLAVTAHGQVHTDAELETARRVAAELGAHHMVMETRELAVPGFAANPPHRCYLCRRSLLSGLIELAAAEGFGTVADGANRDDLADYRPGLKAAAELGIRSPLAEAGLGKEDVRALAAELGLSNRDLPASPCLASRFPYGEEITPDALRMVEAGERFLKELGFASLRLRHHGRTARIEVGSDEIPRLATAEVRRLVTRKFRALGYTYVTLDLQGFRSGSLNEAVGDP
ncbi:MAG: NAD synthetase [Actinobacteria bacterium ADurb.Bin444]|nr:MAG: NAD synthetase [Actinobacteria bacterium ADurb.Bin444]